MSIEKYAAVSQFNVCKNVSYYQSRISPTGFLAYLCAQHICLHNGRENTQPKIAFETRQQTFQSYSLLELLFFERTTPIIYNPKDLFMEKEASNTSSILQNWKYSF